MANEKPKRLKIILRKKQYNQIQVLDHIKKEHNV